MRETEIRDKISEIDAKFDALFDELGKEESRSSDEIKKEADRLKEERRKLEDELRIALELKEEARKRAEDSPGNVLKKFKGDEDMTETKGKTIDSREYRDAWLKWITRRDMTDAEKRILDTGITGTTSGEGTNTEQQHIAVPTEMQNNIWKLIEEEHPFLNDVTIYRTGVVMEVLKHTSTSDADIVAEGEEASEMTLGLAKVTLAGKDFSTYVDLTYAMEKMSLDPLANYLENEIAERVGWLMVRDAIDTTLNGIENETVTDMSYQGICDAMGSLKKAQKVCLYATRQTIFSKLVGMVDDIKRPIFQGDPTGQAIGYILGGKIKEEDGVPEGKILIGNPKQFLYNMVQDVMVETDRDIKKHVTTYSGYARGEGALMHPRSFVLMDATSAGNNDGGSGN